VICCALSPGAGTGRSRIWHAGGLAGACLCVSTLAAAGAADTGSDPVLARGEHIARFECSACHVVAKDQEFPVLLNKPAPAFSEVANRQGVTARTLQNFITMTHWDVQTIPMTMPSTNLSKQDVAAVVHYILSLQQH
jgi:mono/diheme cytochrome c family protein